MVIIIGARTTSCSLTLSTGYEFNPQPPVDDHGAVMVDVKKGDLVVLLSQDEEDGVEELDDLREEIPPAHTRHLWRDTIDITSPMPYYLCRVDYCLVNGIIKVMLNCMHILYLYFLNMLKGLDTQLITC